MKKTIENSNTNFKYDKTIFKPGETHILFNKIKKGKQNIYIVSTPLQLLSAIEAQYYFKTKNNTLIILFFLIGDGKNINQMFQLSKSFPYDKLITFQNHKKNFLHYTNFLKLITIFEYEYVFFGYSTFMYRRIIANLQYNKLFFIDDGVHTLATHKQISNLNDAQLLKDFKPYPNKRFRHKVMRLGYRLKGFSIDTNLEDLNFFTVFNLSVCNKEVIIKHNFSYIRNLFLKKSYLDNKVYFLGQPLTKAINISPMEYFEYVKYIFYFYKDREIIYIPHRSEQVDLMMMQLIFTTKNISILVIEDPIELYFMTNKIYPHDVASFMSSALFNIKKIFPKSNVKAFEIDTNELTKFHQNNIQVIYKNLIKENIEFIKLPYNKSMIRVSKTCCPV